MKGCSNTQFVLRHNTALPGNTLKHYEVIRGAQEHQPALKMAHRHEAKSVFKRAPSTQGFTSSETTTAGAARRTFDAFLRLLKRSNPIHNNCGLQKSATKEIAPFPAYCDTLVLPSMALAETVGKAQRLLPTMRALFSGLEAFLIRHHASILSFDIEFLQADSQKHHFHITLNQPGYRTAQLVALLYQKIQEKIDEGYVMEPPREIRLQSTNFIKRQEGPQSRLNPSRQSISANEVFPHTSALLGQPASAALAHRSKSFASNMHLPAPRSVAPTRHLYPRSILFAQNSLLT